MRRACLYPLVFLLVIVLFSGCSGGPSGETAISNALKDFEYALDLDNFGGDVIAAKDAVLALSYNPPTNPFWTITIWYLVREYHFKSHSVSISGNQATVILRYTIVSSDTGLESVEMQKSFTMQNFSGKWLVNLAEFTGLD